MSQSSREIVKRCLTFNSPERMPRQLWYLPWAELHHPFKLKEIKNRFPNDIINADFLYKDSPKMKGDPYKKGKFTDEWGCVFENIEDGIIGEVKDPIIKEINDWNLVQPPFEQLPEGENEINSAYNSISRSYEKTDKFILANICPRPWERYQFLRGTENSLVDFLLHQNEAKCLLQKIHEFYLREIEFWVKSDVDGIFFMDDWGGQNQLLIPPELWREIFKPLYKDYCELIHSSGKFTFIHSDGFIEDIYQDLIEIGVDSLNSQIFCMDIDFLKQTAKGKITFWGEIDRQHILPSENLKDGIDAVRKVAKKLYDPRGGIICQLEFGIGANPDMIIAVFEEWEKVEKEWKSNG